MPRIRTIYQNALLYAGPSPATGFHFLDTAGNVSLQNTGTTAIRELFRVQNFSWSASTPKQEVRQFGELAAIDRLPVDSPAVSCDFTYLTPNLANENRLGFYVSSGANFASCISNFLNKTQDDKNLFMRVVPEGQDAIDNSSNTYNVWGFGNMQLTSYSTEGAVGDFPRTSVSFQGLNMKLDNATGLSIPAVNTSNGQNMSNVTYLTPTGTTSVSGLSPLDYSVLLPGDINLFVHSYNEGFIDLSDWKVQNYQINFDLSRTPINKLGSKFAVSREIDFPVDVNMRVSAIVGDYATGLISENIKRNQPYNITVNLNKPQYDYGVLETPTGVAISYILRQAYLDSQEYSLDIGGNKTVTLNFVCPLSGPQDITRGLFFSGLVG